MATTADQVVVELEARIDGYLRNMARANSDFHAKTQGMQSDLDTFAKSGGQSLAQLAIEAEIAGRKIGESLGGASSRSLRNDDIQDYGRQLDELRAKYNPIFAASKQYEAALDGINNAHRLGAITTQEQEAAIQRLNAQYTATAATATASGTAIRAAQLQTRNLAFQFQDIATMMAAGQSPFMLLAQQLPQVTMYGGQLTGVMGALRGTVASLISPLGLATTAFVLLGSAAISYFTDARDGGAETEKVLKQQASLIQSVAQRWGDAIPALRAYAQELKNIQDAGDLTSVINIRTNEVLNSVRQILPQIGGEIQAFLDSISSGGRVSEQELEVLGLQDAYNDLVKSLADADSAIKSGESASKYLEDAQAALSAIVNSQAVPAFGALRDIVNEAAAALARLGATTAEIDPLIGVEAALNKVNEANEKYIADAERRQGLTREQLRLETEIGKVRAEAEKAGGYLTDAEARRIAQGNISADDRRAEAARSDKSGARDAERRAKQIERERQAVLDLIDALEFEQSTLGLSAEQKRAEVEVRRAGAAATEKQKEQIRALVAAIEEEKKQLDAIAEAAKFFEDAMGGALMDLIPAIETGNRALDNFLNTLIQAVAQAALLGKGPLAGLFGFAGGGLFSGLGKSIVGGLGGGLPLAIGGLASPMSLPSSDRSQQKVDITIGMSADRNGNIKPFVEQVAQTVSSQGDQKVIKTVPYMVDRRTDTRQVRKTRPI